MRSPAERWTTLSMMVAQLERCMEANARLDAVMVQPRRGFPCKHAEECGAAIGARIDAAVARIHVEMNRLTVERLMRDIERKKVA